MVARIKGNVSEEMLKNAITKVQQRHTLLRVRIKEDDGHDLWFTSEGVQEIPIEIVPRRSENDWIRIHAEASKILYEVVSIVMGFLPGVATVDTHITLLNIGLAALAVAVLQEEK